MEIPPFDFTPQIFRYLERIVEINNTTSSHGTTDEIKIENYSGGEPKSPEIDKDNHIFWAYLEKIGAIKLSKEKGFSGLNEGDNVEGEIVETSGQQIFYSHYIYLNIIDIEKIKALLSQRNKQRRIRSKTLELIAKDISNNETGEGLLRLLNDCGVPSKMIVYPNTKWRMLMEVFNVLGTSPNFKARRILYKIIEAVTHPLFFNGDEKKALETVEKYNALLKYDSVNIERGKVFIGPTDEDLEHGGADEWVSSDGEVIEPKTYLILPDDMARLWVLWKEVATIVTAYQNNKYTDLKPLEALYLEIIRKVEDLIKKNSVGKLKEIYKRPFTFLSTSEIEADAKGGKNPLGLVNAFLIEIISQDALYPAEMEDALKENSELISRVSLAIKNTNKVETQKDINFQEKDRPIKIEITNMPTLSVKNIEDNIVVKNNKKRITLPKFSRTEWKSVSVRFVSEQEIILSNKKDTKSSSFEGLGCDDSRNGRPDDSWKFFLKLAINNGRTSPIAKTERGKQTKQKQKITDILRKIFQNDTDPFDSEKGGVYKAKFNITYPNVNDVTVAKEDIKYLDLNEAVSEMTKSTQENIKHDLKNDSEDEFSQ